MQSAYCQLLQMERIKYKKMQLQKNPFLKGLKTIQTRR